MARKIAERRHPKQIHLEAYHDPPALPPAQPLRPKAGEVINWLIDRIWAFRHRGELVALDQEAAMLDAMQAHTHKRMEEAFGPDWKRQGEERLARVMQGRYTSA